MRYTNRHILYLLTYLPANSSFSWTLAVCVSCIIVMILLCLQLTQRMTWSFGVRQMPFCVVERHLLQKLDVDVTRCPNWTILASAGGLLDYHVVGHWWRDGADTISYNVWCYNSSSSQTTMPYRATVIRRVSGPSTEVVLAIRPVPGRCLPKLVPGLPKRNSGPRTPLLWA